MGRHNYDGGHMLQARPLHDVFVFLFRMNLTLVDSVTII